MAGEVPLSDTLRFDLPDPAATSRLAARIAGSARRGDVIALAGDLGSGKTTFARAFIAALAAFPGAEGSEEEVPSPTFTLVQTYARRDLEVWHFDLYRLERAEEAYELGLEEAFTEGVSLIEWPERLGRLLPADHLEVRLDFAQQPDARRAVLTGHGDWPARLSALAGAAA